MKEEKQTAGTPEQTPSPVEEQTQQAEQQPESEVPKVYTEDELKDFGERRYREGLNERIHRSIVSETRDAVPAFGDEQLLRSRPSVWG